MNRLLTQYVLRVGCFVQHDQMSELIVFLHQFQRIDDSDVVFEPILTNLKHHLDHVLHAFVQFALMQDVFEHFENCIDAFPRHFRQLLADLLQERDRNLHRIVGRIFHQQR